MYKFKEQLTSSVLKEVAGYIKIWLKFLHKEFANKKHTVLQIQYDDENFNLYICLLCIRENDLNMDYFDNFEQFKYLLN